MLTPSLVCLDMFYPLNLFLLCLYCCLIDVVCGMCVLAMSKVIDEADRILEQGFEQELRSILSRLPKERQTILFSATQTKNVRDIARVSTRGTPLYIGVDDKNVSATVSNLEQGYVVCPSQNRFLLLFTFLKKNLKKKVIVFFSTCMTVKYYAELLNYIDIPVLDLHGK